jgi:hypothetical protein
VKDDPTAELEELLEGGVEEALEWWASCDFADDADPEQVDAGRKECLQMYEKTVADVSEGWGPPDFRGSLSISEDEELIVPDGYPWSLCEFAEEVAWWQRDDWIACIWWEQQEPVMPFSVFLGVTEQAE